MNFVRTRPKEYAAELEKLRSKFRGNDFLINEKRVIDTEEGVASLNDAIAALNRMAPLPPFKKLSEGMSRSAYDLCLERTSSTKATDTGDRWDRYGEWKGKMSEMICYRVDDAREAVQQWLMDDGNLDRLNRNYIISPNFQATGVAWSPHPQKKNLVVVQFAGDFTDDLAKIPAGAAPRNEAAGQLVDCSKTHIVIVSERMDGTDPSELQLISMGKVLNLTNKNAKNASHQINCRWQIGFQFDPKEIDAYFVKNDLTVYIHVPKVPSPNAQFHSHQQEVSVLITTRQS